MKTVYILYQIFFGADGIPHAPVPQHQYDTKKDCEMSRQHAEDNSVALTYSKIQLKEERYGKGTRMAWACETILVPDRGIR